MASEAPIPANRRKDPPQRHRDDPKFADEHGFDFVLWARCVSPVENPISSQGSDDPIMQNKPNFQARIGFAEATGGTLASGAMTSCARQSQFIRPGS
jgi:hypothetical protein